MIDKEQSVFAPDATAATDAEQDAFWSHRVSCGDPTRDYCPPMSFCDCCTDGSPCPCELDGEVECFCGGRG